ncbi:ATP-binding protein [Candidatus Woesearchaeota archaeon]|nr:ATP-binding protein [Candidatus Woesearchaeota archaeon]
MESLAKYLVSNFSNEISFNKLKNIFSLKKAHTIKNYVKYLENAYLIFVLERFSFKLKQQIIAPKKIYCIDTGIINSISFKSSENFGKFFENVVCIELLRRKNHLQKDVEIFYWKNAQHEEVDFLVKQKNNVKQLIQVCYNIDNDDVKKRELKALVKASEELKCNNLLVITECVEGEEKIGRNNVRFIPLWKWLLSD